MDIRGPTSISFKNNQAHELDDRGIRLRRTIGVDQIVLNRLNVHGTIRDLIQHTFNIGLGCKIAVQNAFDLIPSRHHAFDLNL